MRWLQRVTSVAVVALLAWVLWPRQVTVRVTSPEGSGVPFILESRGGEPGETTGVTPAVITLRSRPLMPSVLVLSPSTDQPGDEPAGTDRADPASRIDVDLTVGRRHVSASFVKGMIVTVSPVTLSVRGSY